MGKRLKLFLVVLGFVGIGILSALAARVGGIAIRTVGQLPTFDVPQALLPGTSMLLPIASFDLPSALQVELRTPSSTRTLSPMFVEVRTTGDIVITLPCDLPSDEATIVIVQRTTGAVLAHSRRSALILPPGPDCAL